MWPNLYCRFYCIGGAVILPLRDRMWETHKGRRVNLLSSAFPFCVAGKAQGCVFRWCKCAGFTPPRTWALPRFTRNLKTNWGLTWLYVWACAAYVYIYTCLRLLVFSIDTGLPSCLLISEFKCRLYLLRPCHALWCICQLPASGRVLLGGELRTLRTQRERLKAEVWVLTMSWLTEPNEAVHKGKENQV